MRVLILNKTNVVANTNNSQYSYQFPSAPYFKQDEGWQIACSSVAMYNSTFNVEAVRLNNQFQIIFNFATPVTLTVTLTDGYYSASDMNSFVQQAMIDAGYYCIDSANQNIYFFEIVTNSVYYSIQVNLFPIPTSAQATALGYTQGVNASWSYPISASIPQFVTMNNNFGALIGFASSTSFPTVTQTTELSYDSSICPVISPVSTYCMRMNMINSPFSTPSDIFHSVPIDVSFGSLITQNTAQLAFQDIAPNSYSNLVINFVDQNMQALRLQDSDLLITLVLRKKGEY